MFRCSLISAAFGTGGGEKLFYASAFLSTKEKLSPSCPSRLLNSRWLFTFYPNLVNLMLCCLLLMFICIWAICCWVSAAL